MLVPAALADGPGWFPVQDPEIGVTAPPLGDGPAAAPIRYDAVASGWDGTVVQAVRGSNRSFVRWRTLHGNWGIPQLAWGLTGGLSTDGKLLVLQSMPVPTATVLQRRTSFLVLDTSRFRTLRTIRLKGDFTFDAVSPSGRMLYSSSMSRTPT